MPTSLPSSEDGRVEKELVRENSESETYELTVRVSRLMSRTLEQMRIPAGYTSMKSIAEDLVEENSYSISHLIGGVGNYIDFVRQFERSFDIDRDASKFYYEDGQFKLGDLDHHIYMELRMYESGGLKSIQVEADMGKSDVVRISLIKGIVDRIEEDNIDISSHQKREVMDEWYKVRNTMAYYHRRFEAFLYVNFVDNKEYLERRFEKYPGKASDFARFYKEEFLGSDGYERMMDIEAVEPFERLEEMINEYTSVTVNNHVE